MPKEVSASSSLRKILVIEDDRMISNPVSLLLKHYEFDVSVGSSLAQGWEMIAQKPDLVILDLGLPDGNGLQLLEKLRLTGQTLPVFILTGDDTPETARKIRRWVPDGFFYKPLNFLQILEAIRKKLSTAAAA